MNASVLALLSVSLLALIAAPAHAQEPGRDGTLLLLTDKASYVPGELVMITGQTDTVVPLEGLRFQVSGPSGSIVASGSLFPTDGAFSTGVFMSTVGPEYGAYAVSGTYAGQSATASFELVADAKEDTPISLWTDREAYGPGETVTVTGRLNDVWIPSMDIEIVQTKNIALGGASGGGSVMKILDAVRLDGAGRFEYSFSIPDSDARLGDYLIRVSQDVGSATKSFVVAADPGSYEAGGGQLTLASDRPSYDLGASMTVGGKIARPASAPTFETDRVALAVSDAGGAPVGIEYTAIPDKSGRFSLEIALPRAAYSEGVYLVEAHYRDLSRSVTVELVDPVGAGKTSVSIDKEVYGLGETVRMTGLLPPAGENAVSIAVTKPDGTVINSGTRADDQRFSWQWQTPSSESPAPVKSADDRSVLSSNLGVYKISVSGGGLSKIILFKVSADPAGDSLPTKHLTVGPSKPVYQAGEKLKVEGSVIARPQGAEGLVVPERVRISVLSGAAPFAEIYAASVYPDQGGGFSSLFELPATVFGEGQYKVRASYSGLRAESSFGVANELALGPGLSLVMSLDRESYGPGDTVTVTGKPSKTTYVERFGVSVIQKSGTMLACGPSFCGIPAVPAASVVPGPSGSFTYEFTLGGSPSAEGTYEVTADAPFGSESATFEVVPARPADAPGPPSKVIEKVNRIPDSEIAIRTAAKQSGDDGTMNPRVLSGSLATPSRSDLAAVNLAVFSGSGKCVVGPYPGCLVTGPTRGPGSVYETVRVDGAVLDVRYSGPDARLEKFSIVPSDPSEFLPDADWKVEVLKGDQVSRFYYKINYRVAG